MENLIDYMNQLPWENKDFYKAYLAQTFYYTRHSTRMLAMAAGYSSPVTEQNFYRSLINHIKEEQGHDLIAANDLKNLGGSVDQYTENSATRNIWETQFYKIPKNPTHLLGCILALETLAVKNLPSLQERLLKTYPKNTLNFIRVHAEEDPSHVEKAMKLAEETTPENREAILKCYDQGCDLYYYFLMAVYDNFTKVETVANASTTVEANA